MECYIIPLVFYSVIISCSGKQDLCKILTTFKSDSFDYTLSLNENVTKVTMCIAVTLTSNMVRNIHRIRGIVNGSLQQHDAVPENTCQSPCGYPQPLRGPGSDSLYHYHIFLFLFFPSKDIKKKHEDVQQAVWGEGSHEPF